MEVSSDQNPGYWFISNYTTQFYKDYSKPL